MILMQKIPVFLYITYIKILGRIFYSVDLYDSPKKSDIKY